MWLILCVIQGAVPKGNATTEFLRRLGYKSGDVVYKCNKCMCIKPEKAHHCRSDLTLPSFSPALSGDRISLPVTGSLESYLLIGV